MVDNILEETLTTNLEKNKSNPSEENFDQSVIIPIPDINPTDLGVRRISLNNSNNNSKYMQ